MFGRIDIKWTALVAAISLAMGCQAPPDGDMAEETVAHQPQDTDVRVLDSLADLERHYDAKCKAFEKLDGKSRYDRSCTLLRTMLESRSKVDLNYLPTVGRALGGRKDAGDLSAGFREAVLCTAIEMLADTGQRDALVDILSRECPAFLRVQWPLEFHLAVQEKASRYAQEPLRLGDGVVVLFDAYRKASDADNRRAIVKRIRCAFSNIDAKASDEESFVSYCENWYRNNRKLLVLNGIYDGLGRSPLFTLANSEEEASEYWNEHEEKR